MFSKKSPKKLHFEQMAIETENIEIAFKKKIFLHAIFVLPFVNNVKLRGRY